MTRERLFYKDSSPLNKSTETKEKPKFSEELIKEISENLLDEDKKMLPDAIEGRISFREYEEVCGFENELSESSHFLKIKDVVVEAFHLKEGERYNDEEVVNSNDLKSVLSEKFSGMVSSDFIGNNRFLDVFNGQKNKNDDLEEESLESEMEKYRKELEEKKKKKRKKTKKEAMEEIRENDELGEDFHRLKKRMGMIGEVGSGYLPIKMDKKKTRSKYIFSFIKSKK